MKKGFRIDLVRLMIYILKHIWVVILCMAIGAGFMYWRGNRNYVDTYTASGTMYVNNSNPNMINYQYASSSDITSAVMLIDTYAVVVKSNKVMDRVAEQLSSKYPGIVPEAIASTVFMSPVGETGVVRVSCTTVSPQMSMDLCNAILDVAPNAIQDVVGAGSAQVIDFASVPLVPNGRHTFRNMLIGAVGGGGLAAVALAILFLLNQRVENAEELTDNYTPPVLSEVPREKKQSDDPAQFLLNKNSSMEDMESYAKLRMNLFYTLVGKSSHSVMVTSAVSGEGKSTIAANLAISCAMSGKKVMLIDADMRRACQRDIFRDNDRDRMGLSEVLSGTCEWRDAAVKNGKESLDVIHAGHLPPNPAELLESQAMGELLTKLEKKYDLIIIDSPPVNIVSDPLALSGLTAGALFVVRQGFTDHREIRKSLINAEMTGLNVLGFVFYGEKLKQRNYYKRRQYQNYYHRYDNNEQAVSRGQAEGKGSWD